MSPGGWNLKPPVAAAFNQEPDTFGQVPGSTGCKENASAPRPEVNSFTIEGDLPKWIDSGYGADWLAFSRRRRQARLTITGLPQQGLFQVQHPIRRPLDNGRIAKTQLAFVDLFVTQARVQRSIAEPVPPAPGGNLIAR